MILNVESDSSAVVAVVQVFWRWCDDTDVGLVAGVVLTGLFASFASCRAAQPAGVSDLEIISQQAEEESQCVAPVQLVGFTYRDLPLAALDLSLAGSQLLSNLDEEDTREG